MLNLLRIFVTNRRLRIPLRGESANNNVESIAESAPEWFDGAYAEVESTKIL